MSLLTCKDFLRELSDYLDDTCDVSLKRELESHLTNCPNCWVIADTTKKTVEIYHGSRRDLKAVPDGVKGRLLAALQRKMAERRG
jgi:hypothetical protein